MSTHTIRNVPELMKAYGPLVENLEKPDFQKALSKTHVDWSRRTVIEAPAMISDWLIHDNLIDETGALTQSGLIILGRLLLDFSGLSTEGTIVGDKYEVERTIAAGKNSLTLVSRHSVLKRRFVLKILRPGVSEGLAEALARIGELAEERHIVIPTDVINVTVHDRTGANCTLSCLVYPYVPGITLSDFLNQDTPLTPYFFRAFIRQIGSVLARLEAVNAYHGDLHAGNILVSPGKAGDLSFNLIDISYGIGGSSRFLADESDFTQFKQHLWRALHILQRHLPHMSLQKHLGGELYSIVQSVIEREKMTFAEVVSMLVDNPRYREQTKQRARFIEEKFRVPSAIGLLRYEEITDPVTSVELFVPYAPLHNNLKTFGNVVLTGHRGSGKSTYLASLAFFPKVAKPIVDYRTAFGVYFACRQGEFKRFTSDTHDFDERTAEELKHVLVLKVIRRILETLRDAIESERLKHAMDYDPLYEWIGQFFSSTSIGAFDRRDTDALRNLSSALTRAEMLEVNSALNKDVASPRKGVLDEKSLMEFCCLTRTTFNELSDAQFHILFDDAGKPNVPRQLQLLINDLLVSSNAVYCVKLSTERFAYELEDSHGKALEEGHDFRGFDISRTLFLGGGYTDGRRAVRGYFKEIVRHRLQHWNYKSDDITDYLGVEPVSVSELVSRLAQSRRNAYYAGWNVVSELADRTTRNLLTLVTEILAEADVTVDSSPEPIDAKTQNTAIRRISDQRLKALGYVPGVVRRAGDSESLGARLYEFTASIGSIFKMYLSRGQSAKGDWDERLAVERNDIQELSEEAREFLQYLIRFGVLDDTKMEPSRDDSIKKPIYILNRIYCPAVGTSFRRKSHVRLSRLRFEELLLDPRGFKVRGTRFLAEQATKGDPDPNDLFWHLDQK